MMFEILKKIIPSFIREDFLRKLIALAFAILVYMIVSNKIGKEEMLRDIPVSVKMPSTLMLLDDSAYKVDIKIRASEKRISELSAGEIKIEAAVEEALYMPNQPYTLKLRLSDVKAPFGVTVLELQPRSFQLAIDKVVMRNIPVKVNFTPGGNPPDGYIMEKVSLVPPEASVSGPARMVNSLEFVPTAPIPLDKNTRESFDYTIPLINNNKSYLTISPQDIQVQVEIVKQSNSQPFRAIPLQVLSNPEGKNFKLEFVSAPHVEVTLTGAKTALDSVKKEEIKAYVDISGFSEPGLYNVNTSCSISRQDVRIEQIYPIQVQVRLTTPSTTPPAAEKSAPK